ncbi:aldehyde dehydrogenase [Bacteroidales bacterium OttesenSCG-928-I14]|nr:aldehyde dehydrogenase [Bacteroidales bacterium OttesenSCG-928-I14]
MREVNPETIKGIISQQRQFFFSHKTKDIDYRIEQLKRFKKAILKREKDITDALWQDLHKSQEEAYLTEISIVLQEIENHLKHLRKWSKDKRVSTPLHLFPSKSTIHYEPLGVALIIAPWNYPFQLLMNPLVGAISAGCCAILKPSPYAPATSRVMAEIITSLFPTDYISIVEGGREVNQMLLDERFDIIFFTGSPQLGKVVMEAAAKHLTPIILELGGKSPCIVDKSADLSLAARRIAWGKTINAGQTCIAPDYLFVHKEVKEELISKINEAIKTMYGKETQQSPYYPRIVNRKSLERLQQLMVDGTIVYGGKVDENDLYIEPTIIDDIQADYPIMQEEIFGPLLPVMTFINIDEVINYINSYEKPLALYYFGKKTNGDKIVNETSSGGACINDTLLHIANHKLPFGGVGNSGMGKYHGHDSFKAFSNARSILSSSNLIDLPVKYAPFKGFARIKGLL